MIWFTQPAAYRRTSNGTIMPHLDAAFSLARFLMRNEHDAEDVVQDASLRAFRFLRRFRGENSRAWFLRIVRNAAFTALKRHRGDEEQCSNSTKNCTAPEGRGRSGDGKSARRAGRSQTVRAAIEQLPPEFREVIILRELEECSYKEIADIAGVPIGTVMSRLARARQQLHQILCESYERER